MLVQGAQERERRKWSSVVGIHTQAAESHGLQFANFSIFFPFVEHDSFF